MLIIINNLKAELLNLRIKNGQLILANLDGGFKEYSLLQQVEIMLMELIEIIHKMLLLLGMTGDSLTYMVIQTQKELNAKPTEVTRVM